MSFANFETPVSSIDDLSEMRDVSLAESPPLTRLALRTWGASALALLVVGVLLCLGAANIASRASWNELEDGVLWVARPEGVTAAEVAAGTAAAMSDLRPGDLLLAIDGRPVEKPADVITVLHAGPTTPLKYTLLRLGEQRLVDLTLAPVPQGNRPLYYLLAGIGIFTLLVGTSVRLRRPRDAATLHFFWLCLAFFGTLTFSYSGRFDRLDWFFYWADAVATLLLPPLFLHFALVFPERPRTWARTAAGRTLLPLLYLPALLLLASRIIAVKNSVLDPAVFVRALVVVDRLEPLYLTVCLLGGLAILVRALRRVRSLTGRRQLRWIVWGTALGAGPFAVGYALPFSLGATPSLPMELLAVPLSLVPLAFASAIVRYRLMDVEVIVKRGLVWTAAVAAILAIYAVLLRLAGEVFLEDSHQHNTVIAMLATLIVVLLARPVKNAIQNTLDRAFYRDRYDYRRALVGFARDLNGDLDLNSLGDRLVTRVVETLVVDRMALMLADERTGDFHALRAAGFQEPVPALEHASGIGGRIGAGHAVALDEPLAPSRFSVEEIDFWREFGIHYFVPCVAKGEAIAVLALGRKESGEPLNSEDVALLAAVAGQAATALENGRLYQQLRLKAEELERTRQFNENIVESLDDGVVVLDQQDGIVRWNRAMEQIYGVAREEAAGRPIAQLFDVAVLDALQSARRESPAGSALYRVPVTARGTQQGRRLLVNIATVPLLTAEGSRCSTSGTIVIFEDITSRVRLEEQLQISEKMASIGLLAAGVAHEVNTPLTGISSFTQMLLEGADADDPRTRVLEKIERQTFRAAKIVNGLLNLSRQTGPGAERGRVDLNAIVNDVLSLLEHQFEIGRIKVRRELSAPAVIVSGVEHKLQQVFLNLFLNARDAMPRGGWLSITTRVEDGHAIAEVADTGSGIPSEHLSRIYDPFFSTKAIGKGTGLGLSITYGIVREHDGTLTCESAVGQGTRFTLTLPMAASAIVQQEARQTS
jgi:two-component system NtrC family sensor kinase